MWRLIYLLLLFVRIYFALCPSYLHPDEIFQGPEVIAGHLFPYPSHRTWEWTVANPVRSVFPLWIVYGIPITLLKWVWVGDAEGTVPPAAMYYTLRMVMFMISFVLEDWAIHELLQSPRHRGNAILLVASSYVTWTLQTHTFSNSIETLLVLWSLVLIERIVIEERRSWRPSSIVLGFLLVFGTFNRITFPAFILIPGTRLLPHFVKRPLSFLALSISALFFIFTAVATDTSFYSGPASTASFGALISYMRSAPVMTPLNNLRYNSRKANLAEHGLHPHYQHLLVNLPQLLGPALLLLVHSAWPTTKSNLKAMLANPRLTSAATGTLILSLVPHQEPRFLLPCIPLLLTCIRLPSSMEWRRNFWISWAVFNILMSVLMGIYHQGGIIPTQLSVPTLIISSKSQNNQAQVFWWKTYPPPTYLLGSPSINAQTNKPLTITTTPLMGVSQPNLLQLLSKTVDKSSPPCDLGILDYLPGLAKHTDIYLAAPYSAWRLESIPAISNFSFADSAAGLELTHVQNYRRHINLDDMDFGDDGVWATLARVVGRRGLGVWRVTRLCAPK